MNNNTNNNNNNNVSGNNGKITTHGSSHTDKGTMPNDKLMRFKLNGNFNNDEYGKSYKNDGKVKRLSRIIHGYRLFSHGCIEPRLSSNMRQLVHYFCIPMSKDNNNDIINEAS